MSQAASGERTSRSRRPEPDRKGSVAARLVWLVENIYPPGRKPFSAEEIAQGIRMNGGQISADYVRKILAGDRHGPRGRGARGPAPDPRYLEQIAHFFGTNLSFFEGDGEDPVDVEEMRDLAMLRSPRLREIVTAVIRDRGLQEIVELTVKVPRPVWPVVADMIRASIRLQEQASMAGGDARPAAGQ